ncbi:hypothetical protein [Limosilactobacillus reuteri]
MIQRTYVQMLIMLGNFFDASQLQVISRYSNAENGEGDRVDYGLYQTSREIKDTLIVLTLVMGQLVVSDFSTISTYEYLILFDQTAKKQAGVIMLWNICCKCL